MRLAQFVRLKFESILFLVFCENGLIFETGITSNSNSGIGIHITRILDLHKLF